MSLTRFDYEWSTFLKSGNCPPILGLVPLPEAQYIAVNDLIAAELNRTRFSTYETILYLMDRYRSILAIWIARKSGQAYDAGAFWDRFAEETGVTVPLNRRGSFTFAFRRACRHSMVNYTEPKEQGTRKYVEVFLYQAGIPLDQCPLYAQMLRRIERQYGLPDPNSDESAEELRSTMLSRPELAGHPMLHKALRGAAGAYLCEAALNSVSTPDFSGVNPRLRDELARAFEHAQVRRAARPPFVRLGEDYCSLEIVGPRQDEQSFGGRTPEWRVDGQRYWVSRSDELVIPLAGQPRVTVELRGLSGGLTVLCSFVINLREREQPFMLFDYESRKLRREANGVERAWYLKSGHYWLLHATDATVTNSEQEIEWPDGERQLSLIRIQPGMEVRLEMGADGTVSFKPDLWPFLEPNGEILSTANEQLIHYRWQNLPTVWLPSEDNDDANDATWTVKVVAGGQEQSWPLTADPAAPSQDGMTRCNPFGDRLLAGLAPKLYEIGITVFQGSRAKVNERFIYWAGLRRVFPASQFVVSALPENLERNLCEGFGFSDRTITHVRDYAPEHTLAFMLDGGPRVFRWSQPGTFLYSAEKRPGTRIQWTFHPLDQRFSASVDSSRWLRIRCEPAGRADLLIAGADGRCQEHPLTHSFIDLSLADLATRFAAGGKILLHSNGLETPVARFTRPLVPQIIDFIPGSESVTLRCRFADQVRFVRPRLRELITGCVIEYRAPHLAIDGRGVFMDDSFPEIVCSTVDAEIGNPEPVGTRVDLHLPKSGWPLGFWIIQMEVRQNETSDWQLVTDEDRREVAVLVSGPLWDNPDGFRVIQFHRAYLTAGYHIPVEEVEGHEAELCDLLTEIQTFMRHGFAEPVRPQFQWLDFLYRELGKHAGRVVTGPDADGAERLLNLACQETHLTSGRSLFVSVPRLLGLLADRYREIPINHPLPKSLQWCGRLARHSSVLSAFKESIESGGDWALNLASHFRNFPLLARTHDAEIQDDLSGFAYARYRDQTIGPLAFRWRDDIPVQPEWDDGSALSRSHIEWALCELARRRQETHGGMNLGAVNALLHAAPDFLRWLRNALRERAALMPASIWAKPWLPVTVDDDDFMENCSRFASLFALAARTSAFGSLDFDAAIAWLSKRIGSVEITERTLATLVGMAPELVGYYLMFWELMIRTYPHE